MKKTIQLNQETFAYCEWHEQAKEVVLLIHGNMSSSLHYLPIAPMIAENYRVLAPDLRGFGDSTYHQPIEHLDDFADDLKTFMDALNVDQAHLVGWSTGGGIALSLAARHPERVISVTLIESASVKGYPIFKKDAAFQPILTELYQSKEAMALDPVQVLPAQQAMEKDDVDFMRQVWQAAIYNVKLPEEEALALNLSETLKQRNLIDVDWALMTFNMSHESNGVVEGSGLIDELIAPILNIWSRQDYVIPEVMFKENEALLPKAEHLIYDDGSHSPITDFPERLAQDILTFIKKQ